MPKRTTKDKLALHCAYSALADPAALVPNPRNPNQHPKEQLARLVKLIQYHGWRAPITVSKRSGFVVRGHGRLQAALLAGWTEVPIDQQDYATEAEEHADLVADNHLAALAHTDEQLLAALLTDLTKTDLDLDLTGFSTAEFDALLKEIDAPLPEIVLDAPGSSYGWVCIGGPVDRFAATLEVAQRFAVDHPDTIVYTAIGDADHRPKLHRMTPKRQRR